MASASLPMYDLPELRLSVRQPAPFRTGPLESRHFPLGLAAEGILAAINVRRWSKREERDSEFWLQLAGSGDTLFELSLGDTLNHQERDRHADPGRADPGGHAEPAGGRDELAEVHAIASAGPCRVAAARAL